MARPVLLLAAAAAVAGVGIFALSRRAQAADDIGDGGDGNGDNGGDLGDDFTLPPPPPTEEPGPDNPFTPGVDDDTRPDLDFQPPSEPLPPDLSMIFGTGADGKIVATSGMTLSRDMHYTELGVPNGIALRPNGHRIFAKVAVFNFGIISENGGDGISRKVNGYGGEGGLRGETGDIGGFAGNGGLGGNGQDLSPSYTDGLPGSFPEFPIAAKGGNGGLGLSTGVGRYNPYEIIRAGGIGSGSGSGTDKVVPAVDLGTLRLSGGGGGGGGGGGSWGGGGGGAGAGIIVIAARYLDNELGLIIVKGGDGAWSPGFPHVDGRFNSGGGGGGGGGGGTLVLIYASSLRGQELVDGGVGGYVNGLGSNMVLVGPIPGFDSSQGSRGNRGTIIRVTG